MKITSKGQVTIPLEIRKKMGLLPHTEVTFQIRGNAVQIVKVDQPEASRGRRLAEMMRGKATIRMTTDEIMALTRGEK
ncbi:MAG: AbrB/MazE/SpoVT family DNA-binding domain-containing protein [Desulfobulbaceae bacterium]|nr:AbrB/MazE/SpoVT family DNA-binding domain-containing protein [Desulfobulbaceae bacterium]